MSPYSPHLHLRPAPPKNPAAVTKSTTSSTALQREKTGTTPRRKNRGDSLFSRRENGELYRLFRAAGRELYRLFPGKPDPHERRRTTWQRKRHRRSMKRVNSTNWIWRSSRPIPTKCLQMTAEWYKIFYAGSSNESTYKFCTQQIAEYVESARKRNLIWTGGTDFKSVPLIADTQGSEKMRKGDLR